jgi:hypothetical protein
MVELIAASPSLGVRGAAREAARQLGLPGQLSTHEDRLKKKYAKLRDAEQLPAVPEDAVLAIAGRYIREAYAAREAGMQRLKDELAAMEQEAVALGFDISDPDLDPLIQELGREVDRFDLVAGGDLGMAVGILMERRLPVEAAVAEYELARTRSKQLKKGLELLLEIRHRRRVQGLSKGFSPLSPQE